MIELTRNQKIGFGFGAAGVLLVTAIVVIYFVFFNKKDTPKPNIKSSGSTKADTDAAAKAKAEAAAKADAAAKAAAKVKTEAAAPLAKSKDLEPIQIQGKTMGGKEYEVSVNNDNPSRPKDTLIENNEGCWTFLNAPGFSDDYKLVLIGDGISEEFRAENGKKVVFITKVTLPSDVRAEAWGHPFMGGVCKFTWKADIEPGETITFDVPALDKSDSTKTFVYGLKFTKV